MTLVAHQRYAELVDEEVYLDTLAFHGKAHYAILPPLRGSIYLTGISDQRLAGLINADVSVAGTGRRIAVEPSLPVGAPVRMPSAARFGATAACSFHTIQALVSAALMAQGGNGGAARMPYPSGGALYSVLTFVCRTSGQGSDWPGKDVVYQVQPFTRALESLSVGSSPQALLDVLCGGSSAQLGEPDVALVYALHLDRALFKYRYRGYRLASMEVGAMYQRVTQEAQARGLGSRVWAGFSDHHVAAALGLDATHVLPMVVQFLGR